MSAPRNPFQYEAASKLNAADVCQYYVENHNHTRFIRSKRNILLVGDRGSGKSMALRYHSLPIQTLKSKIDDEELDLSLVCIHVPCNTPLMHRREYDLLESASLVSVLGEHFLVVSILIATCKTFLEASITLKPGELKRVQERLELLWGADLSMEDCVWDAIDIWCQSQLREAQRAMNRSAEFDYRDAMSFVSGVVPFFEALRKTRAFQHTHFSIMLDDVQDLTQSQTEVANSWLAYRDNSLFSFKIARTKTGGVRLRTSSGGQVIEGHDFTRIDMEGDYQNKQSDFGKLAREIVSRRLDTSDVVSNPEDFFPVHDDFLVALEEAGEAVKAEAIEKYGIDNQKAVNDHVYKYRRVHFFRNRPAKANTPTIAYTGFDTLVELSTGIIRNLLEPCYWMYDKFLSDHPDGQVCESISPTLQSEVILELSQKKWDQIRSLPLSGTCSENEAIALGKLLEHLAVLFRERLEKHESEPRAIKLFVTGESFEHTDEVVELLGVGQRAQLIYTYESSGKEKGSRRTYYVPNRMLWPVRSLDPCGQHSVVSILAEKLWRAAFENKPIPMTEIAKRNASKEEKDKQKELFGNG